MIISILDTEGHVVESGFATVKLARKRVAHILRTTPPCEIDSITIFVDGVDVITMHLDVNTFTHVHLDDITDELIEKGMLA